MDEDIAKLYEWVDQLEGRLHRLEQDHIPSTWQIEHGYSHLTSSPEKPKEIKFPERHIDWLPKDVYALRKVVERQEYALKCLRQSLSERAKRIYKEYINE